jgi:PAS domain S-box-containing protein
MNDAQSGPSEQISGREASMLEPGVLDAIEQSPVPVQVARRDGAVVLENAAFRARFRSAPSSKLRDVVDEVQAGRPSALQAALAGHSRAVPLGVADGVRVVALYAPLRTEGQEDVARVSITYVTAWESSERAEHRAPTLYPTEHSTLVETQLRFIVDNVPQLIWSALPDGFVDFYNRRWNEYIGASFEATQGAGWNDRMHPDDQQRSWECWQYALNTGETYQSESRFRGGNGEYRWFLGRAVPMRDASGRIVRWFGSSTDIDDQKRSDQDRSAALEELERATRLKDDFLATASHELRTPLNAILGWAAMQRVDPALSPRAMEVIERNARALAALINDLLDTSRIVANKLSIEPEPVDVAALVRSVVESCRPAATGKRITVQSDVSDDIGSISADPNRIRQVIANLLSNAVKFTPPGGKIKVEAYESSEGVSVRVSDTGHGIPKEFLPHVFDRFRQEDGSRTRREGGLGLGLSIARHLVELHGGELRAESDGPERGATFTMTVPATHTPSPSTEDDVLHRASGLRLDGIHVLVVDDDGDARDLLATVLARAGATVDQADSVGTALEMLARRRPDLVLSDVGMPERSGYDLAAELRSRDFDRPVVALTAFARSEDRADALTSGFDDHIAKPVEPALLVKAIARLVGRPPARFLLPRGVRGSRAAPRRQ